MHSGQAFWILTFFGTWNKYLECKYTKNDIIKKTLFCCKWKSTNIKSDLVYQDMFNTISGLRSRRYKFSDQQHRGFILCLLPVRFMLTLFTIETIQKLLSNYFFSFFSCIKNKNINKIMKYKPLLLSHLTSPYSCLPPLLLLATSLFTLISLL